MAAILAANFNPSVAPLPNASKTFPSSLILFRFILSFSTLVSVSGYIIFEITSAAGAL